MGNEDEVVIETIDLCEQQSPAPKPWYKDKLFFAGIVAAIVLAFLTTGFLGFPTAVFGDSMHPSYENGQVVFVSKNISDLKRFDVVAIDGEKSLIKRIVGLPGDTVKIEDGVLFINGKKLENDVVDTKMDYAGVAEKELKLTENEFFVLGDNRNHSDDSRYFGAFTESEIIGKVTFIILK